MGPTVPNKTYILTNFCQQSVVLFTMVSRKTVFIVIVFSIYICRTDQLHFCFFVILQQRNSLVGISWEGKTPRRQDDFVGSTPQQSHGQSRDIFRVRSHQTYHARPRDSYTDRVHRKLGTRTYVSRPRRQRYTENITAIYDSCFLVCPGCSSAFSWTFQLSDRCRSATKC